MELDHNHTLIPLTHPVYMEHLVEVDLLQFKQVHQKIPQILL